MPTRVTQSLSGGNTLTAENFAITDGQWAAPAGRAAGVRRSRTASPVPLI